MLEIQYTNEFKHDLKTINKRGYKIEKLNDILNILQQEQELPEKYKDHDFEGKYKGCRECHIKPDWLLIYQILNSELTLITIRTGTHSDLF